MISKGLVADLGASGQVAVGEQVGGQPGEVERALAAVVGGCIGQGPVEAGDRLLAVPGVAEAELAVDAGDGGIESDLVEEPGELRVLVVVDGVGELVLGAAQGGEGLAAVGEVGVGDGFVGQQERDREGGAGVLGGDLAELEELQRCTCRELHPRR
ncbi:hypothetical protein ACIGNX_27570 [Actinosynnema sp. NPDC053489]|uniref:hypothetical protein n=1 Tax=Actinosynnema sp. NPDC053489 TaxID=3363916 RepID=UPI0037C68C68